MTSTPDTIKIIAVRIANFRSLQSIEISLDDLTILIGPNNVGKTSFLDAFHAAIGTGRQLAGKEDIHLRKGESDAPKDRKAMIDVLIKPTDSKGAVAEQFPPGSFWTNLWGEGLSQDEEFNDFVAIRTTLACNPLHGEYKLERRFLKEWLPTGKWQEAEQKERVSIADIEPLALHYIDAKRDIEDDLRVRSSLWHRLVGDFGLDASDVVALEAVLSDINTQLVTRSSILRHIQDHLSDVRKVVFAEDAEIEVSPVARRLRDLSRGVDINLSTASDQAFPLTRHGMGTRSLASLLVFRAFATWKREQADKEGSYVHSVLALEEPEAHLHPQAQRSLFAQIRHMPGQRIVSTHSPYFAGQAKLEQLRLFKKEKGATYIAQLATEEIEDNDKRKLEQKIIATRGDILFARGLVLFEGETEEQALPVWAENYWDASIHELGFSFVGVGGRDYFPFVWLAQNFSVPWFIYSDGEEETLKHVGKCCKKAKIGDYRTLSNVVLMGEGNDFEKQLVADGYLDEIESTLNAHFSSSDYIGSYMSMMQGQRRRGGALRDYGQADGRKQAALDILEEHKTRLAIPLALTILNANDESRRFPPKVAELFAIISHQFGLTKGGSPR